jgi:hypothetical protein
MIVPRDYSITLEQQIENIINDINEGLNEYPIDIVDTLEFDNQIYYQLENGYWEKYSYDANGEMIGYLDSTIILE